MGTFRSRLSEVAGLTLASRVLGLLRDVLLFAVIGNGVLASAFLLAFTLPNLFRRLLGEGALSSSSIPVLTEVQELQGSESAFKLLNALLARLFVLLVGVQVIGITLLMQMDWIEGLPERWYLGSGLAVILFPYMAFICLSALICGMLNVLRRFALAAFNQIWLNLAMLGALIWGLYAGELGSTLVVQVLCGSVLFGGLLQLLIPAAGLRRAGWQWRLCFEEHAFLGKVLRLFLPGIFGAALFQVNTLVTRLLAFALNDTATGLLYIANRLVELPLGLFGIAIATVVFPDLSRHQVSGAASRFSEVFSRGMRLTLAIMLPATVGLILLSEPILKVLFQWGLFGMEDVAEAVPVLQATALGLPFFAASALLTRAWYAIQELRKPALLALVLVVSNAVLGMLLMRLFGAAGLAFSNVLSSAIHCLLLAVLFPGRLGVPRLRNVIGIVFGLLGIAGTCLLGQAMLSQMVPEGKIGNLLMIVVLVPASIVVYAFTLVALRHQSWADLRSGD